MTEATWKVIFADKRHLTTADIVSLIDAGFNVIPIEDIDAIKTIGDVPLRDYFAAKAMQGLVSHYGNFKEEVGPSNLANYSYQIADSMLKERAK